MSARKFVAENGGEIVGFADIPRDYVLGAATGSGRRNTGHSLVHL